MIIAAVFVMSCGSPGGGFTRNPYEFTLGRYYFQSGTTYDFTLYLERLQPGGFDGLLDCEGWIEFSDRRLGVSPRLYFKNDRVLPFDIDGTGMLHGSPITSYLYYDEHHQFRHAVLRKVQLKPHIQEPRSWMVEVQFVDKQELKTLNAWVKR